MPARSDAHSMPVQIVVDSAASLPPEMSSAPGLHVVPMRLELGGRSYLDVVDLSPTEFYRLLREYDEPPRTSSPAPAMFREAFERSEGSDVLCLTVAARFSSTYDSARAAAAEYRAHHPTAHVLVLDTESAAGGQGLVALEAWRAAQAGRSLQQAAEAAQSVVEQVRLLASVDTLYYLSRSGRVPKIAHAGNSLIGIKPVFELARGEVQTRARPRGTKRAIRRMVKLVRQEAAGRRVHAAIMHADAPQKAEDLRALAEREISCREVFVSEFTPGMGAHIGPGLLGIAYWVE